MLTNMLASGRPVVATADVGTGLAGEVDGCGIITAPEDAAAFSEAIVALLTDESAYSKYADAARERAESRWAKTRTLEQFELGLLSIASASKNTAKPDLITQKKHK